MKLGYLMAALILLGSFTRPAAAASVIAAQSELAIQSLAIDSVEEFPVAVDKQQRLRPMAVLADGRKILYDGRVRWSTPSDAIELTDSGFVTGLKPGKAMVSVSSLDHPTLKASLEFEVRKEPVTVYFQAPKNWNKVHAWFWYLDGKANISGRDDNGQPHKAITAPNQGAFPGPAMQPVDGMPGWFFIALPRWDDPLYAGKNLVKQPIRLVFSNPDNGEKTRDFVHYDGCFLSYNRYLQGNVIDGRWDGPMNCPAFPKRLRVLAEGRGGPIWGPQGFVDLLTLGTSQALTRFTLDGSKASLDNGSEFPKNALILDRQFNAQGEAFVCTYAQDILSAAAVDECFRFYRPTFDTASSFPGLGVTWHETATTFAIWSPDRNSVELWLEGQTLPMGYIGDQVNMPGVWAVTIPGDHKLKRYQYLVDDVAVRDPYAVMVQPGTDYNIVLDPARIAPAEGWAPTPPLVHREDAILYELSIRDFTSDTSSGVSPENRGKFMGLVEPGTFLNKGQSGENPAIKTGIEHLKELGVTHVQIMPVYDFATCGLKDPKNGPNCYNWGYDPENFNVPEERYSRTPMDYENRIREFQTMVNELHKAGIRVILDVVYNHTWMRPFREADEGEKYFGDITGRYFLFNAEGFGYQLTGTGNTIDPKDPMVHRYIRDSLEYWVKTYNIDGFRFDVAGVFDYMEITDWMTWLYDRFPDRQLLAYGEPYTAMPDPDPNHYRLSNAQKMVNAKGQKAQFGGFNFSYREAIKGNNDTGYGGGFAFNGSYDATTIINGLRGSLGYDAIDQSAFADDPVQTINYATSHDNLNLFDKINAWAGLQSFPVSLDYKKRIAAFANGIILVSQGIPFLHSGEEFARTKAGIPDSYQAGDAINRVHWGRKAEFKDLFDFYKQMVNNRRRFAGLRLPTQEEIDQSVSVQALGQGFFELRVSPNGKNRSELLILLNSGPDREYNLPAGDWYLVSEQGRATQERKMSGRVMAGGTALTFFHR
ncbi:alpha-amylase family glycosyl hydrolase [Oligoflexus tunisiensis]|uniref:alpha-amylase family glycosyl hydrolase n=1 Tax=Oligoflexus tunisiensis TaxID=708132 RepID=UPI000B0E0E44|nr:alpha-amylase family glycosyl hydrolase [Oligoflexus tunisiensis]